MKRILHNGVFPMPQVDYRFHLNVNQSIFIKALVILGNLTKLY